MEGFRKLWKGTHSGDGSPGGPVQGITMGAAVEMHRGDLAVRIDGETDQGLTGYFLWRMSIFRKNAQPLRVDHLENFVEVGIEIYALCIREDLCTVDSLRFGDYVPGTRLRALCGCGCLGS